MQHFYALLNLFQTQLHIAKFIILFLQVRLYIYLNIAYQNKPMCMC